MSIVLLLFGRESGFELVAKPELKPRPRHDPVPEEPTKPAVPESPKKKEIKEIDGRVVVD